MPDSPTDTRPRPTDPCFVCEVTYSGHGPFDHEFMLYPYAPPTPGDSDARPTVEEARLEEIEARAEAATEGPWGWRGQAKGGPLHLISLKPPMYYVMEFTRHGMRGGQPVFRVEGPPWAVKASEAAISSVTYADRVCDIAAPDARFLAAARGDIDYLLARVKAEAAALQEARDEAALWKRRAEDAIGLWHDAGATIAGLREQVEGLRVIQRAAVAHSIAVLAQSANADETQDERHAEESFATFEALTRALQNASPLAPTAPGDGALPPDARTNGGQ